MLERTILFCISLMYTALISIYNSEKNKFCTRSMHMVYMIFLQNLKKLPPVYDVYPPIALTL